MNPLYLLIPTFLIMLLIFPIKLQLRGTFHLEDLSGVVCLFLFKIKLRYYKYKLEGKKIILKNEKETKVKTLDFDPKQLVVVKIFKDQLKDKARIKELFVFYNIGLNDAFLSSMVGGLINCTLLGFFTNLKNRRPTASMGIYDTISYNSEVFEVAGKGSISISLFDVVYSLIMSVILIKRLSAKR